MKVNTLMKSCRLIEVNCYVTLVKRLAAARTEIARRSKDTADRMKERMREAKDEVETEQQNKLDISSGTFAMFLLSYDIFFFIINNFHFVIVLSVSAIFIKTDNLKYQPSPSLKVSLSHAPPPS